MTRKEIYDALDLPHMKVSYALGAFLYDEATDRGGRLLAVEAIDKLDLNEQNALNVFIMEQIAAEPGPLPEEWETALQALGVVLGRRPVLRPALHGEGCPGNGEDPGIECQCDECDYAMLCHNPAIGRSWEEVRAELFTPEEIAGSDRRVKAMRDRMRRENEK